MTVNGYIEAIGEYDNMIIFNSNYLEPEPEDWQGVYFEATSDDNSRLSYCDIRHAHNGVKLNYASPTIDHCIFAYNGNFGLQLIHSASEMYNITSTHNQQGGIFCDVANAIINNSIIAFNSDYGIRSIDSNPVLSYNDVYSNSTNYSGCTMGWGSISDNPDFIGLDDFHLQSISPCINIGDPNRPNDPDGTRSDMGALYYLSAGVEGEIELEILPVEFKLMPAYPNPFNASTTIEYWLPAESDVRLAVYSVLGEEVAEVVSGQQSAGIYQVIWQAPAELSSGLYFCRIEALNCSNKRLFTQVNKLMLLK